MVSGWSALKPLVSQIQPILLYLFFVRPIIKVSFWFPFFVCVSRHTLIPWHVAIRYVRYFIRGITQSHCSGTSFPLRHHRRAVYAPPISVSINLETRFNKFGIAFFGSCSGSSYMNLKFQSWGSFVHWVLVVQTWLKTFSWSLICADTVFFGLDLGTYFLQGSFRKIKYDPMQFQYGRCFRRLVTWYPKPPGFSQSCCNSSRAQAWCSGLSVHSSRVTTRGPSLFSTRDSFKKA